MALSDHFRNNASKAVNPYGNGATSDQIVTIVKDFLLNDKIDIKKKFYDIKFDL